MASVRGGFRAYMGQISLRREVRVRARLANAPNGPMLPSKGLLVMRMKHMTTRTFLARLGALAVALALASAPAWPQATPGRPAEPPTAAPPAAGSRPTLVPNAGDPVDVDEVTLPAKPVAMLSGSATWD